VHIDTDQTEHFQNSGMVVCDSRSGPDWFKVHDSIPQNSNAITAMPYGLSIAHFGWNIWKDLPYQGGFVRAP
jgi:hypothetical protein